MKRRKDRPGTARLSAVVGELRLQLAEARETLEAIRTGAVDALVVASPEGDRIFSLESAETPYRLLVEQINEGALMLRLDGTMLYANARFAQLANSSLERLIGSTWRRFFLPADHFRLENLFLSARSGGARQEFTLLAEAASPVPVEVSLSLLHNSRAETFSAIVTDLTHRKLAEDALRIANQKLAERLEELEHFSYAIIHDLRAPLRGMQGFASLLEEEYAETPKHFNPDYLRRIRIASHQMDQLITDSLNYSRTLLQQLPLEPVNLAELISNVIETYPNLHPKKAEIHVEPNLPIILGNPAAVLQCFSNLLGNAVKFAKPGLKPCVIVRAEPVSPIEQLPENAHEGQAATPIQAHAKGATPPPVGVSKTLPLLASGVSTPLVRIWVEDNGIGIPEDALERIFGMFQRAATGYEGTGVGLAIVRKLVQRMGGRVGVESEEDHGSRFWVELHRASAE